MWLRGLIYKGEGRRVNNCVWMVVDFLDCEMCLCVCLVFCVEVEISNEVPVRGDIFGRGFWGVVFP